ncbi:MAG: hypothetical protein AB7L13_14955 [Acidimicrobiia bacterium]
MTQPNNEQREVLSVNDDKPIDMCSVETEDEDGNPVQICDPHTPPKTPGEVAREQAALDAQFVDDGDRRGEAA